MFEWFCVKQAYSEDEFESYRDTDMCCSAIYDKKDKDFCDVCGGDHISEERLARCTSVTCGRSSCSVAWKVRHCVLHDRWLVYVKNCAHTRGARPCAGKHPTRITRAIRSFLVTQDLGQIPPLVMQTNLHNHEFIAKPIRGWPSISQIRHALKRIREEGGDRNTIEAVEKFVATRVYSVDSEKNPDRAVIFGPLLDSNGYPKVGSGYDNDPFLLGVTSPRLLDNIVRYADGSRFCIFHADATFKLSDIAYPVITCGFTDKARSYQVAALFVVSQRTTRDYGLCFRALADFVLRLRGVSLKVEAVMGDADHAQLGGIRATPTLAQATPLMCFFHVVVNVRNHTKHLSDGSRRTVMRGVLDMHFSPTIDIFQATRDRELNHWRTMPEVVKFAEYFTRQWLSEPFWRWQIFHTPGGYAATNNPCEVYNSNIKGYVQRRRFHMTRLLLKLCELVESHTPSPPAPNEYVPRPTSDVIAAANSMISSGRTTLQPVAGKPTLRVCYTSAYDVDSLTDPAAFAAAFDKQADIAKKVAAGRDEGAKRDAAKTKASKMYKRAVKWSLWRSHSLHMPPSGWEVDYETSTCGCMYFAKFHVCAHLVIAQHRDDLRVLGKSRKLLDRSRARATRELNGLAQFHPQHQPQMHPSLEALQSSQPYHHQQQALVLLPQAPTPQQIQMHPSTPRAELQPPTWSFEPSRYDQPLQHVQMHPTSPLPELLAWSPQQVQMHAPSSLPEPQPFTWSPEQSSQTQSSHMLSSRLNETHQNNRGVSQRQHQHYNVVQPSQALREIRDHRRDLHLQHHESDWSLQDDHHRSIFQQRHPEFPQQLHLDFEQQQLSVLQQQGYPALLPNHAHLEQQHAQQRPHRLPHQQEHPAHQLRARQQQEHPAHQLRHAHHQLESPQQELEPAQQWNWAEIYRRPATTHLPQPVLRQHTVLQTRTQPAVAGTPHVDAVIAMFNTGGRDRRGRPPHASSALDY